MQHGDGHRRADAGVTAPPRGMALRQVAVLDSTMAYVETDSTDGPALPVVVFLHGNPTSSFLWRKVLAALTGSVHAIAVDLIGMGRSGKPDIDYGFIDHRRYLEAFVDRLGLRGVVLVGHDWGAVLALNLAARRPDVVGAVAVCEGHLHPFPHWSDLDEGSRGLFSQLRQPDPGERMVIDENFFVEVVLQAGMAHSLTDDEWAAYRAPFARAADRRPILRWIQQIPIENDPVEVTQIVVNNQQLLLAGALPRLLMYADPGSVVGPAEVLWARENATGLTMVDVGPGTHFLPEDQPDAIADAIRTWLPTFS